MMLVTITLSGASAQAFATTTKVLAIESKEINNKEVVYESINFNFNPETMTKEEKEIYNKSMDIAIEKQVKLFKEKVGDTPEVEVFKKQLTLMVKGNKTSSEKSKGDLIEKEIDPIEDEPSEDTWIPNVKIKNVYFAAAINTIIDATLIAIGAGSITVALKKYGAQELKRIFTKSIKTKLMAWGALALAGSIGYIADFMMNVVNPGNLAAEALDARDSKPNNGYIDLIL